MTKPPIEATRAPNPEELRAANETFALTPVQRIAAKGNVQQLTAFFDAGSNIHLVRRAFAEEAGWVGTPVRQSITTTGGVTKDWDTTLYSVPLVRSDGTEVRLLATALDQITEEMARVDVAAAAAMFGCRASEISRPSGQVDLLIGIQSAGIFPTVRAARGNLRLLSSQFGSGLLLDGAHPEVKPAGGALTKQTLNLIEAAGREQPEYEAGDPAGGLAAEQRQRSRSGSPLPRTQQKAFANLVCSTTMIVQEQTTWPRSSS